MNEMMGKVEFLKSLNFQVETIIDIGVDHGTDWLYEAFQGKRFILVDPRPISEEDISMDRDFYQIYNCALGSVPGRAKLSVEGGRSSILTKCLGSFEGGRKGLTAEESRNPNVLNVDVRRLDDIVREAAVPGRFGVKIDVEGFEIEVMKGGSKTLADAEFVILEVNVQARFIGQPSFSEMVAFMANRGFGFYNTLAEWKVDPGQYNIVFLPFWSTVAYLRQDENHPMNLYIVSREALRAGDAKTALQFAEKAIERDPTRPKAHYQKGLALKVLGDYEFAADSFKATLQCYGSHADARFELSRCFRRLGSLDKALEQARLAVEASPMSAKYQAYLGNLAYDADLRDEAEMAFETAIECDRHFSKAIFGLSKLAADRGEIDKAISWCRHADSQDPAVRKRIEMLEKLKERQLSRSKAIR